MDKQLEVTDCVSGSMSAFYLSAHVANRILEVFVFVWFAVDVPAYSFVDGSDVIHGASVAAFVFRFSIAYVYFILSQEKWICLGISVAVFRRRKWMQTLKSQ